MYFCVKIKSNNKFLVIKKEWIRNIDMEFIRNFGLNVRKPYCVFYSPFDNDDSHFDGDIQTNFIEDAAGCYNAFLLKAFGKNKNKCVFFYLFTNTIFQKRNLMRCNI